MAVNLTRKDSHEKGMQESPPAYNIRVEYRNINSLIVVFNSMHNTNIKVWRL